MNRFEVWVCAWVSLLSSLVKIFTFGYINSSFDIDVLEYYMVKNIKKRKAERENIKLTKRKIYGP